jgi:hypothetical protein
MGSMLFKKVDYPIRKLLEDIALGEIALPDIQRPFVWSTTTYFLVLTWSAFDLRCVTSIKWRTMPS